MKIQAVNRAPGSITGKGTGYKRAIRMFEARQKQLTKIGRWRCGTNAQQFKEDGFYIDPDYYLVDWSMTLFDEGQGRNILEEINNAM